jgi:hypothetical protein
MGQVERVREELSAPLSLDYLKRKAELGWRPVAIIWERDIGRAEGLAPIMDLDVPYGLKVSTDCSHLEENADERKVLMLTMELIVQDHPLSRIADELNRQSHRTRAGFLWNPSSVFELLPRLIEAGPRIFTSEDWIERRKRLMLLV